MKNIDILCLEFVGKCSFTHFCVPFSFLWSGSTQITLWSNTHKKCTKGFGVCSRKCL